MTLDDLAARLDAIASDLLKLRAESVIDPEFSEDEAADLLHMSPRTLQVKRLSGEIGFYRHGRGVRIGASHIAKYQQTTETRRVRAADRKTA